MILIYNEAVIPERFDFFQDIFIHFPYKLTTGKSRPQKTWQYSNDFPLREGENRGRKGELRRAGEREREPLKITLLSLSPGQGAVNLQHPLKSKVNPL